MGVEGESDGWRGGGEAKDQQALLFETKHLRPRFLPLPTVSILLESRCFTNKGVFVYGCVSDNEAWSECFAK